MKPENLVKNAIGREVPTSVQGLGEFTPYANVLLRCGVPF